MNCHISSTVASRASHPSSALNELANLLRSPITPIPYQDAEYVEVDPASYDPFFSNLRESMIGVLYPDIDTSIDNVGIISDSQFRLACQYLMQSRIDHVYFHISGDRSLFEIPHAGHSFKIPKSLADIINSIGRTTILNGAFAVIPKPIPPHEDEAQRLTSLVNFEVLQRFERLVIAAEVRNYIKVGYLSTSCDGRSYWLMSARKTTNPNQLATIEDNSTVVQALFREWQTEDVILAAMAVRGFDGRVKDMGQMLWTSDPIRGLQGVREQFNLHASRIC